MVNKKASGDDYEVVPINDEGRELDGEHLDDDSHMSTFDLGLSAALVSVGFSLVSLDRANLSQVQFIFRRGDEMDEVVNSYWADRLEVKARTYFDSLKMLKNRLYSE